MSQDSTNQSQKGECPKCKGALSGGLVASCLKCGSVWTIDSMGNAVPPLEVAVTDVQVSEVVQPVYNADEYQGIQFASAEQMAEEKAIENSRLASLAHENPEVDAKNDFVSAEVGLAGGSVFDSLNSTEPPVSMPFLDSTEGLPSEFPVVHDAIVLAEVGEEEPNLENIQLQEGANGDPSGLVETNLDQNLDITEYANSEISQAKDGQYLFRVWITGIDTKEVRSALREEMSDSRFQWDVEEIMASIKSGRLQISNLSPVKASILINRIKRLPLQIRWEQDEITQMGVV